MINAAHIHPEYYYPDEFQATAENFFQEYQLVKHIGCPTQKMKGLKEKKTRQCRFCQKKYPFVGFSNDAHIISEFLGNKYFVSDFECDSCNLLFSGFENDLANFLGITRTVQSVKGKKVPKFKSSDNNLEAESISESNQETIIKIRRSDRQDETFIFDKVNERTVISYSKSPYTPLRVFKAVLKMALSILNEEDLFDYKIAFEYLTKKKYDNKISGFAFVWGHIMPLTFQYANPAVFLFKKKNSATKMFSHVFVLTALNFSFQITLPFNRRDGSFYSTPGGIDIPICPPFFGRATEDFIRPLSSYRYDLNSTERVRKETEAFAFKTRPGEYDKSRFRDKETGEITEEEFDGTKIIGIDIIKTPIDLK